MSNPNDKISILPISSILIGIIRPHTVSPLESIKALSKQWGKIKAPSRTFPFNHSTYYHEEMGTDLVKEFAWIESPLPYNTWAQLKENAMEIENSSRIKNKRQINLDPTIITPHNVILLSCKNYSHRIPLTNSIFAEIELLYKNKAFEPLPWTYPDFVKSDYHSIFNETRKKLLTQSSK